MKKALPWISVVVSILILGFIAYPYLEEKTDDAKVSE
jgi:hypothetical protein